MTVCRVAFTYKGIKKQVCLIIKFKTLHEIWVLFVEPLIIIIYLYMKVFGLDIV
jgi:hypothetical protein